MQNGFCVRWTVAVDYLWVILFFLVVNISRHAAEGGRKISFSNYFNEVPNVSLMRLLRENSNESLVEACLSMQRVIDGFKETTREKAAKQKEVSTKPTTGIKITHLQKTEGLEHSLWVEIYNGIQTWRVLSRLSESLCMPEKKKKTSGKKVRK